MDQNWPITVDELHTSLTANNIMAMLANQVQQTSLITSLTNNFSLGSENDFGSGC